jgi:hypothetical protein
VHAPRFPGPRSAHPGECLFTMSNANEKLTAP